MQPHPSLLRVAHCQLHRWLLLGALFALECVAAEQRFEYEATAMGVPFRIVVYTEHKATADAAVATAFERMRHLDRVLTDYDAGSELSLLSRSSGQGRWVWMSPDLSRVLDLSLQIARASEGKFDPTVGPAVILWRKARRERRLPDPARLEAARDAIGFHHVELSRDRRRARLNVPDMRLDVGGIGKGFAADEAARVLEQAGVRRYLVAAAGDIRLGAPPPDREAWKVELGASDVPGAPEAITLALAHAAVSTSGDLFQHVEIGGVRYSHIVDPFSRVGLTNRTLVTVVASCGTDSDAWSTAVSVGGPHWMLQVARKHGWQGRVVEPVGEGFRITETRGFSRLKAQPAPATTP